MSTIRHLFIFVRIVKCPYESKVLLLFFSSAYVLMRLPSKNTPLFLDERIKTSLQLFLFVFLYLLSNELTHLLSIPLPANLIGMVILSTLLYCNVIPSEWCREGANFLLAEMMLFFVPTVVAIIKYIPLLIDFGWKIFLVIAVSSLTVFGTTAWVVDKMYKFEVTKRSEIK